MRNLVACVLLCVPFATQAASVARADLDVAPQRVEIEGSPVLLQVSLWKDLMPKVTSPGVIMRRPGYQMRISLLGGAGKPSPSPEKARAVMRPERIYVLRDNEVWEGNFSLAQRIGAEEYLLRGGPSWPHGITVDVVVQFTDQNGKPYLIKAVAVPVEAVH